jgi:hypothetical protein
MRRERRGRGFGWTTWVWRWGVECEGAMGRVLEADEEEREDRQKVGRILDAKGI